MAIFTVTSNAVENVDIMISTSFKAGMALMRDDNGRGVPADSQLLVFKTLEQKAGKFLGFATSDHSAYSNTIIIPDVIGSSYIDNSYNYIRTENNEVAVSKRGLVDNLNEGTPNLYNPSDQNVISRRGLTVYNQPNNIFITDQFKAVLHGDYGLDGLDIVALNPGDLLTFGGGVNAGKLVKVNVNSFGPELYIVGIVEKYVSSTNLLHFRQASFSLNFGNSTLINYDAANILSYPRSGSTWFNLASTSYNMTLFNGPTYSSANGGVMVFDGADDYATSSGFSFTNFTMEMFVNVYQLTGSLAFNRIVQTDTTFLTIVGSPVYGTVNALSLYSAVSGYTYGLDGENATVPANNILLYGTEFKVNRDSGFILPLIGNDTNVTVISYPLNEINSTILVPSSLDSADIISYLWVNCAETTTDKYILINYNGVDIVLLVEIEYRYTPINIHFKNKEGCQQVLTFFKERKDNISVTSEQYNGSGGQPLAGKHQFVDYNVNSKSTFTVASGFVDEENNETFKQLLFFKNQC